MLLVLFVQGLHGNSNSPADGSASSAWSDGESSSAVDVQPSTHSPSNFKPRPWRRGGNRYCGQNLVRALRLLCNGEYAEPSMKRSYSPLALRTPNYAHLLWRQVFDVKDTDKLTWPEVAMQYDLLFGNMDENGQRRYSDEQLQRLAASLRRLAINKQDDLSSHASDSDLEEGHRSYNSLSSALLRSRRGIYDECCAKPCSVNYLRTYCKYRMMKRSDSNNDETND